MNKFHLIPVGVWIVLTSLYSGYMHYLKAPSVVAARPELAELGFWTALFSGRFSEWLFATNPVAGVVYAGISIALVLLISYVWVMLD